MKRNQFEFFPDNDPEFDKALAELAEKYDQPVTMKKTRCHSPDVPEFFASSPVEKVKDERNYDREIMRLERKIDELTETVKSLKAKKRNKTEDKELKSAEMRLKRCEDDLFFATNARNFSASNN